MVKAQPLAFTPRDAANSSTQLMVGTVSMFSPSSEVEGELYFFNLTLGL
jgi:hypothetical protein